MAMHPPLQSPPPRVRPHPALCLGVGFGVIIAGATLVHLVFHLLV